MIVKCACAMQDPGLNQRDGHRLTNTNPSPVRQEEVTGALLDGKDIFGDATRLLMISPDGFIP